LPHRLTLELGRELWPLDHRTPPVPLSPLSGVRNTRATPGSVLCCVAEDQHHSPQPRADQSSAYFRMLPRALSAGYLAGLIASFSRAAVATSMPSRSDNCSR